MGTSGRDVSLSSFGVAGRLATMGVLGLDGSETRITGRVLSAAAWPFMWSFFMWCTTTAALKACWGRRQKPRGEHLAMPGWAGAAGRGAVPPGRWPRAAGSAALGTLTLCWHNMWEVGRARSWHKHRGLH